MGFVERLAFIDTYCEKETEKNTGAQFKINVTLKKYFEWLGFGFIEYNNLYAKKIAKRYLKMKALYNHPLSVFAESSLIEIILKRKNLKSYKYIHGVRLNISDNPEKHTDEG